MTEFPEVPEHPALEDMPPVNFEINGLPVNYSGTTSVVLPMHNFSFGFVTGADDSDPRTAMMIQVLDDEEEDGVYQFPPIIFDIAGMDLSFWDGLTQLLFSPGMALKFRHEIECHHPNYNFKAKFPQELSPCDERHCLHFGAGKAASPSEGTQGHPDADRARGDQEDPHPGLG